MLFLINGIDIEFTVRILELNISQPHSSKMKLLLSEKVFTIFDFWDFTAKLFNHVSKFNESLACCNRSSHQKMLMESS